jgi:PAS domain S-box-containing protein
MDLQQTTIFENLKAAIMATDCAGSIVYWNPFAEVLYGWLPEEVLGRDITDIALNSTTYEEANAPMAVVRASQSWSGESMVFCKRGEILARPHNTVSAFRRRRSFHRDYWNQPRPQRAQTGGRRAPEAPGRIGKASGRTDRGAGPKQQI